MCFWVALVFLIAMIIATPPYYPYSRSWGYYPASGAFVVLIILLVLWWLAWLPGWFYPVAR